MLIVVTDERAVAHRGGPHHPESPERLRAVLRAVADPVLAERVLVRAPLPAGRADLARVHGAAMLDRLDAVRGTTAQLDADTAVSPESVDIAESVAGAGLTAVAALGAGEASAAFCAVRPPGHHATGERSMGFCLLNNVAVTAAALAARGERVLIADFDAHHGNGTQDIFYDDPSVLFLSWHQSPLYPGTGAVDEIGGPGAEGTTVNVPLAPGTTGDAYLSVFDEVLGEVVTRFAPTWLLISAGFDAHRRDPLTDLGLSSGDFGALTALLMQAVPPSRTVAFLEGGYDIEALQASATSTLAALAGISHHPEPPSSGSVGSNAYRRVADRVADAQGVR